MLGRSVDRGLFGTMNRNCFERSCQFSDFECFAGIELKSLILAQIERWRHALHMQVERQHGCLHLVASGERVSNASERAHEWGIARRKPD